MKKSSQNPCTDGFSCVHGNYFEGAYLAADFQTVGGI